MNLAQDLDTIIKHKYYVGLTVDLLRLGMLPSEAKAAIEERLADLGADHNVHIDINKIREIGRQTVGRNLKGKRLKGKSLINCQQAKICATDFMHRYRQALGAEKLDDIKHHDLSYMAAYAAYRMYLCNRDRHGQRGTVILGISNMITLIREFQEGILIARNCSKCGVEFVTQEATVSVSRSGSMKENMCGWHAMERH